MRRKSRRVSTTNINFKTSAALKAECERALKRHKDMDGRLTTFFNDCMRQFVIQMRNKSSAPAYPLEFVVKSAESGEAK